MGYLALSQQAHIVKAEWYGATCLIPYMVPYFMITYTHPSMVRVTAVDQRACDCNTGTGRTDSCATLMEAGEMMVVDPSLEEEATATGLMTVIINAFGELCAVQKTSGIGLPASEVCL